MNNLKGITDLETKLIWFEPKLFWSGQNISIKKSPTDTTQTRYLDGARLKRQKKMNEFCWCLQLQF